MTDTSKKEINVPMPYELKALKSATKKVEKKTKIKVSQNFISLNPRKKIFLDKVMLFLN